MAHSDVANFVSAKTWKTIRLHCLQLKKPESLRQLASSVHHAHVSRSSHDVAQNSLACILILSTTTCAHSAGAHTLCLCSERMNCTTCSLCGHTLLCCIHAVFNFI